MRGFILGTAATVLVALLAAEPVRADLPPDSLVGETLLRHSVILLPEKFDSPATLAALGKRVFFDSALSEPAGLACAGCHDPVHAYSGNRGSRKGVAPGAKAGRFALRNTPSVLYSRYVPPLYLFQDDERQGPEPRGGLFDDGRVDSLAELPAQPLLNPLEMNNGTAKRVMRKLAHAPYASEFKLIFGRDVFGDPERAMAAAGRAIAAFLNSDEMAPFSSRYDAYIRGKGTLSPQQLRGLALFRNPYKGNCAFCHTLNETSSNPARSLFTDQSYDAVGAPRNSELPANRDPRHYDLGLCETAKRKGWPDDAAWCGHFRTPSLRNVAVRERYMHNGVFKDLRSVVAFYARRATNPSEWYTSGVKFDDLPTELRSNVNVVSVPYNRREAAQPPLSNDEIDAIVAFLGTLTDSAYEPLLKRTDIKHMDPVKHTDPASAGPSAQTD